ncbi:hypothetical protein [Pedobacter sp. GR22-6]|uniref:hypothetical protein n=1 Tax=Pedobacter sp. GR22-6 TaxID=3127957 RepID=UPI00307D4FBA
MKKTLILLMLGFAVAGCGTMKEKKNAGTVQLSGKIEKLEMSTFQYGTHVLKQGEKIFALRSDKVKLDTYVDKEVTVKGLKVEGYPVENGPDFIDVQEVTVK